MLRGVAGRLVRSTLGTFGYDLVNRQTPTADAMSLEVVVAGQVIDLVLDVGANTGQTGEHLRAHGYRGRIISFEPQSSAYQSLLIASRDDASWECRHLALGESCGTLPMRLSKFTPSSSLLRMAPTHTAVWPGTEESGVEEVEVRPLDSLANELQLTNHRVMLKIDVQGYEIAVLRGAIQTLSCIQAASIELLFAPLYDGQSRYFEVMALLEESGLQFAGFSEVNREVKSGRLMFANGVFLRQHPITTIGVKGE